MDCHNILPPSAWFSALFNGWHVYKFNLFSFDKFSNNRLILKIQLLADFLDTGTLRIHTELNCGILCTALRVSRHSVGRRHKDFPPTPHPKALWLISINVSAPDWSEGKTSGPCLALCLWGGGQQCLWLLDQLFTKPEITTVNAQYTT
jgi:hypothetical protein